MRLLDRYLLREFLVPFAYCLMGFLVFWISFDLIQELVELQRDNLNFSDFFEYYLWKLPELFSTVLPVALLLAMLYALTHHSRHNELTAMRSAGIGLWRICVPYLCIGVTFSLLLFALNEIVTPQSADAADQIRRRHRSVIAKSQERVITNFGFASGSGRLWQMGTYDVETGEMTSFHAGWKQSDLTRREIIAQRGNWTNNTWVLYDVVDTTFSNSASTVPFRVVTNRLELTEFTESPQQIRCVLKVNRLFANLRQAAKRPQLSIREILNYRSLYPEDTQRIAPLLTQLHGRLAAPWTCLVVVLIAIPFGAPAGRRNAFVGVAASIFICFTYFILLRLGLTLGTGDWLPPWLAAWGPNLIFSSVAILLTHQIR